MSEEPDGLTKRFEDTSRVDNDHLLEEISRGLIRNDRNETEISASIKRFFFIHSTSTAKSCCRTLGLNYKAYGGRARKIKHDLNLWRRSIVTDRNGRDQKHHIEWGFKDRVPDGILLYLQEKASGERIGEGWYRSRNRNGQVEYVDPHVRIRVHRNGRCRIFPRFQMNFDELRVHVDNAFCNCLPARCLLSEPFSQFLIGLEVKGLHRTFPVGPITPFRNSYYKDSLGLVILADGSHPNHLETHEGWPSWISVLFESQRNHTKVLSEFTTQIKNHLHVLDAIGGAANRLNTTVERLNLALDSILRQIDGTQDSDNQGL